MVNLTDQKWNSEDLHTWSFEHVQHSLCDCKSTSDVDGGDECCHSGQSLYGVGGVVASPHQQESSHGCDSGDSIGHRHQRGVEGWCYTPHGVIT